MRRIRDPKKTSAFIMIGVSLMIFIKVFLMGEYRYITHLPKVKAERTVIDERIIYNSEALDAAMNMLQINEPLPPKPALKKFGPFMPYGPPKPRAAEKTPPLPKGEKAYVVVIIDDMGMSRKRSNGIIALPGPLTLAFLPYAPKLPEITLDATQHGHELMIHVPMEAVNPALDPGPLALLENMDPVDFDDNLKQMFDAFSGYKGINNHMGSRLTQNKQAMDKVMAELARRDLYFVDSKTINSSVAANEAAAYGLRYASRDVFLDNEDEVGAVRRNLAHLERAAHARGVAIAIGHPKDSTIQALQEWIPTLKDKNLVLIPASKAVHRPAQAVDINPALPQSPVQQP